MEIRIHEDHLSLGRAAGRTAAGLIRKTIVQNGQANIVLATGVSQFETLNQSISEKNIDWGKVVMFHLDEYIGLPESSPASFRRYLKERFLEKVLPLKASYLVNGESDPVRECERVGRIIKEHPIDVALAGIGENGHLAFNDPPADFDTEEPYIIGNLEDGCRRQQFNEGWFKTDADVPAMAITMSIKQVFKSKNIICSVPDDRKAKAVKNCLTGSVSNVFPASILQRHPNCIYFLDKSSSALLSGDELSSS